jgi:hypothetical protein
MKKLVLLGLAILISMSVVAAASVSTMHFSGVDIEGSVETKSRTGYFIWGVKNRASAGQVEIMQSKISEDITLPADDYWTDGYVKFNLKNPTTLERFDVQLTKENYPNSHWDYEIYGTNINGCNVAKNGQNTYTISCVNAMINTTVYVPDGAGEICTPDELMCVKNYYVKQEMPWTFTAIIKM